MKGLVSVHFVNIRRPINGESHMNKVTNKDRTYFSRNIEKVLSNTKVNKDDSD